MKGYLTENQIAYVLFHLGMSIDLNQEIRNSFIFRKDTIEKNEKPSIIFKLDKKALNPDKILNSNGIPLLFSAGPDKKVFDISGKDVIFHHDLLKSVFYLLSGYQELHPEYLDSMGRYPYELSIQSKLNIIHTPVVNYYFRFISEGIKSFCKINKLPFNNRKHFNSFAFLLTHDIDQVDTYNRYDAIYKLKQSIGVAPTRFPRKKELKYVIKYIHNTIKRKKNNPAWSFPMLIETALKYNLRPTYFFLPKDQLHHDAYYRFDEERIQHLFKLLEENDFEIGLHGTVKSSSETAGMLKSYRSLESYSPQKISGIRQHRLLYNITKTPILQENQGLQYDSSLGFAEHEGFRNSYCLPYRLFDHNNDRMMNLWEIPLNAMDVTLMHYRQLSYDEILTTVLGMVEEIKRFNGTFVLLWHNNFFNEEYYPRIKEFYISLIERLSEQSPEGLSGREIIHRISNQA